MLTLSTLVANHLAASVFQDVHPKEGASQIPSRLPPYGAMLQQYYPMRARGSQPVAGDDTGTVGYVQIALAEHACEVRQKRAC